MYCAQQEPGLSPLRAQSTSDTSTLMPVLEVSLPYFHPVVCAATHERLL